MATSGEFRVAVTKEDLVFAAAHFITLAGHRCESLHGHNYRVGVTLEGALDGASWTPTCDASWRLSWMVRGWGCGCVISPAA